MLLSKSAHNLLDEFFRSYEPLEDFDFSGVQVYARRGSWLLTNAFMLDGIALGNHVFVNPRLVVRDDEDLLRMPKDLIVHELVHVAQYRREGAVRFLAIYVRDFWREFRTKKRWNLRTWLEAYTEIPHEVEARRVTSEFIVWLENRGAK